MRRLKPFLCLFLSLLMFVSAVLPTYVSAAEGSDTTAPEEQYNVGDIIESAASFRLLSKGRSTTDHAEKRVSVYMGPAKFNAYWLNGSTWSSWGSYTEYELSYYMFASGAIGYCIAPWNLNTGLDVDRNLTGWDRVPVPWSSAGTYEVDKRMGVTLAMAYGAPNNGDNSNAAKWATAMVIWEIAAGYRKSDGSMRYSPSPFYEAAKDIYYNTPDENSDNYKQVWTDMQAAYNELITRLSEHGTIPSFTVRYRSQITDAQTILLELNPSTGLYEAEVEDTNKILKHFNYVSNVDGLTFTKNGNILKITATAEAAGKVGSASDIGSRGAEIEISPDVVACWTNGDVQTMATMTTPLDPVPSYFRLKANVSGSIEGTKNTDTGTDLGGWQFNLMSGNNVIDTATSDSNGRFSFSNVAPGTYTIQEVVPAGSKYESANNNQTVTVTAGNTAFVTFLNKLKVGKISIIKKTNTGANLGGWQIKLYSDSGLSNLVGTYTTGDDGTIMTGNLTPGTYYAKEVGSPDPYWVCDTETKTVVHISVAILKGMTKKELDAKTFARNCGVRRTSVQKLLQGDSEVPLNEALKMLA